ncbi:uncharacterized protein LOC125219355 isoform X3 [Salvia hispanica]|uniref:uncharacterized protein LOC125219355 isoform X3 n=1 Tax=Salvia hispanica TaxID=49212 RepID=UPI002009CCEA|nr:uncharacterized protein LOC125219355 isoform X3 [Salvia hispanica]
MDQVMASKGRRQRKKNVRLQDEPNISHQRLTNPEDFTTKTTLGRRIYNRNIHQEESNTVTHSNHEDMIIDIEQEEDEGESQQHTVQHIGELLVELHQLIDAQAQSIIPAKIGQQSLTEEAPGNNSVMEASAVTHHFRICPHLCSPQ